VIFVQNIQMLPIFKHFDVTRTVFVVNVLADKML
jgi:hypothetical protein